MFLRLNLVCLSLEGILHKFVDLLLSHDNTNASLRLKRRDLLICDAVVFADLLDLHRDVINSRINLRDSVPLAIHDSSHEVNEQVFVKIFALGCDSVQEIALFTRALFDPSHIEDQLKLSDDFVVFEDVVDRLRLDLDCEQTLFHCSVFGFDHKNKC